MSFCHQILDQFLQFCGCLVVWELLLVLNVFVAYFEPIITSCMIMSSLPSNSLRSETPTKQHWEGTGNVHYQCTACQSAATVRICLVRTRICDSVNHQKHVVFLQWNYHMWTSRSLLRINWRGPCGWTWTMPRFSKSWTWRTLKRPSPPIRDSRYKCWCSCWFWD